MKTLFSIGEALIEFMPEQTGVSMKHVTSFKPAVGGAPANVCGAFAKLGGVAKMITQLGDDAFGDKIVDEFKRNGIGCEYVFKTPKANTSLAFVALQDNGDREFTFFRNPGADMLLGAETIQKEWFIDGYVLHFCSVSLGDFPMKEAHKRAIQYAREQHMLISFDPNLRPALWSSKEAMIQAVREFIPLSDVVKVSEEELELITGETEMEAGIAKLFCGDVKLVLYTKGADGAKAYTKYNKADVVGIPVKAVDTTGAGDGFIGAFLYRLCEDGVTVDNINDMSEKQLKEYLSFANLFCSKSVQTKGAIISYPTINEMEGNT
ncbi:MAG: carbohydrate kinase [Lachnospiraceae bacterium]|nr:carbohydrate kinase [Lachnospiraceae bacterium]